MPLPAPHRRPQIEYEQSVNNTVAQFMAFQKALPDLDKVGGRWGCWGC